MVKNVKKCQNHCTLLNILETRELDGQICKCVILAAAGNEDNNKRVVIMQSWCEAKKGVEIAWTQVTRGTILAAFRNSLSPKVTYALWRGTQFKYTCI